MYFAISFIELFLSHLRFLSIDSVNKCSGLSIKIVSGNQECPYPSLCEEALRLVNEMSWK
jgi:hypothetical protein